MVRSKEDGIEGGQRVPMPMKRLSGCIKDGMRVTDTVAFPTERKCFEEKIVLDGVRRDGINRSLQCARGELQAEKQDEECFQKKQ